MNRYRLCGIQIETGNDPGKNLEKVVSVFSEAIKLKPDFVILPEMFEIVTKPEDASHHAHAIPSEITDLLSGLARDHSVNVIGGSFFEREGESVYNTALVYDRKGEICGKYRKIHLFDAFGYGESNFLSRGNKPLICELDGLKFGVAICYDIRFPEIFRYYAVEGAQVVFLPAAFFQPNHDHWQLNIKGRALDNTIFVMTSNQTGKSFVGRSMIANPWGVSVASMGIEEGFYISEIDVSLIEKFRGRLSFLKNRRFDVSLKQD
jgi:predicted amidohydrolase